MAAAARNPGHAGPRRSTRWCSASITSAGAITTPMLRVSAASAPAAPATHHRRRRAPQNAVTDRSRNSDSL